MNSWTKSDEYDCYKLIAGEFEGNIGIPAPFSRNLYVERNQRIVAIFEPPTDWTVDMCKRWIEQTIIANM